MKKREFVRKAFQKIKDTDIQDLKNGIVSVLVVRNIPLSLKALLKQLNRIGKLQKQDISSDFVNTVIHSRDTPKLPWHTDRSYHPSPPCFVALYSLKIPAGNPSGNTRFCDMQQAYQDLSKEMAAALSPLQLLHLNRYQKDPREKPLAKNFRLLSAVHPLVQSDKTGKYLFFNQDYTDSFPIKQELCEHVYQKTYIYTHCWSPFDLVISNNLKTNHCREKIQNLNGAIRTILRFHLN